MLRFYDETGFEFQNQKAVRANDWQGFVDEWGNQIYMLQCNLDRVRDMIKEKEKP